MRSLLLRLIGVTAVAWFARRLPPEAGRRISIAASLVVNAFPLFAVMTGHASLADVLGLYWIEVVICLLATAFRMSTAQAGADVARLTGSLSFGAGFVLYACLLGGGILAIAVVGGGFLAPARYWAMGAGLIAASAVLDLGFNWMGAGRFQFADPDSLGSISAERLGVLTVVVLVGLPLVVMPTTEAVLATVVGTLGALKVLLDWRTLERGSKLRG